MNKPRSLALITADLLRLSKELAKIDYVTRGNKARRTTVQRAAGRKAAAKRSRKTRR